MHQLGARGIRLNFQADGREVDLTKLAHMLYKATRRIQHLPGWMVQLYVPVWVWDGRFLMLVNCTRAYLLTTVPSSI